MCGGRGGVRAGIGANRIQDCGGGGRGSGNIKWTWPSRVHATVSGVEFVARAVVVGVVVCWWTAVLVDFNA